MKEVDVKKMLLWALDGTDSNLRTIVANYSYSMTESKFWDTYQHEDIWKDPEQQDDENVVYLISSSDVPADRVLRAAIGQLESVVITGWCHDGTHYGASSKADAGDILFLIEALKQQVIRVSNL